jgi:hypothetical protein
MAHRSRSYALVLATLLLTLSVQAGQARQRAQTVLVPFILALQHNDIPTIVRLAEPNMRALIDRDDLDKYATSMFIDSVAGAPVRVVESSRGVVYFGWERTTNPCGTTCGWNLMPLVVGEGRAICKYTRLAENPQTTDTREWQVSALHGKESWRLAHVRQQAGEAAYNARLATIDEQLLIAWYFDGSNDARRAIERQMGTHDND